ncbi:Retrovirus-related Pol polyprotein from transposon 17.6 [Araneus ventricosus]|uniref:Retrovirus-related Pol polyprotein from transposon 17.6 n=1 Tax=Araneus ventricosus TaxID=182803 RepID=A0A4Y2BJX6_ARAVE|nr:Retrovirus-related Pol polyprotein from transposon 17.6 [Araneus ventricosus]
MTPDLKSGYWQVEIRPEDREKTVFTTRQGLWQFNIMPFGLCNAPATFERLMETVLHGLSSEACLVYLDDIIIFGGTFAEHLNNLCKHRKGTSHGNADALSRRPCKESCNHCMNAVKKFRMETDISVKVLTTTIVDPWFSCEIQVAQQEDPDIRLILEKKLNSADQPFWQEIAPESPATKRYWALWGLLTS